VGDRAVVTLEEVLARDLPVRCDLPVGAVVEDELVDVEAGRGDPLRNVAQQLGEGRCVVVEIDKAERPPAFQPHREERDVREIDALALRPRSGAQRAVQVVRPGVVRALERLPVTGFLDDDGAPMAADVHERALGSTLVAHHDDRHTPCPARDDVAVGEDPDVLPRAAEDRVLLPL
jgi:hypothetical protein